MFAQQSELANKQVISQRLTDDLVTRLPCLVNYLIQSYLHLIRQSNSNSFLHRTVGWGLEEKYDYSLRP